MPKQGCNHLNQRKIMQIQRYILRVHGSSLNIIDKLF